MREVFIAKFAFKPDIRTRVQAEGIDHRPASQSRTPVRKSSNGVLSRTGKLIRTILSVITTKQAWLEFLL